MREDRLPIKKIEGPYRYFKRPPLRDPKSSQGKIFERPRGHQVKGTVRLGHIQNTKIIFGIFLKELVRHLLICGSSGSGKSNFLRVLQLELNRLEIPFLVFDTAKLGSRFLKPNMKDLMILRWNKDFSFNPLQPPKGVTLKEWLMVFSEITTELFGLRTASKLYLTEFVQNHFFQKGNANDSSKFPIMHDLIRSMEARLKTKIPINERGYINGIHSKLKAVCITLDEMINVHEGIPIDKLLKYPVCIELVGIKSAEIQYWLISLILAAIASYREAQPMSFGKLRHVFFLDEASHVVGLSGGIGRESYILSCIRRLREYGEAIVLADQCITTIDNVVKSNTYTIIGMNQVGQKDRREMISVLGLNSEQAQVVNYLNVGQGIIRLGGRYPFPQLIQFPFVKPENFSDRKIDAANATDKRTNKFLGTVKHATESYLSLLEISKSIPEYTDKKESQSKTDQMFGRSKDMLLDIFNRFDVASTTRANDFGLSASASNKIFKYIEREQFVEVVKLNLSGGRGKTSKYYVLTKPKGHEAIGKKPPKQSGGTGAMHFFIQRYLKKHLSDKGFSGLTIEKNIEGKRIDLFGIYKMQKIGIEICCTTTKTEYLNVNKDFDKCDLIILVTPDKKTKFRLEKELLKKVKPNMKVKTCIVYELLSDPGKIINQE